MRIDAEAKAKAQAEGLLPAIPAQEEAEAEGEQEEAEEPGEDMEAEDEDESTDEVPMDQVHQMVLDALDDDDIATAKRILKGSKYAVSTTD
jgi:hypothetical protein